MNKKTLFFLIFLLAAVLYPIIPSFAETITLKSGEKIDGAVIEKNSRYVKIDYKGAVIVYRTFEIQNIGGKAVETIKNTEEEKPLDFLLESKGGNPAGAARADVVGPEELLARGFTYYSKGNFDQAISDLSKAIKLKSDYTEAYLYRGLSYISKNDPEHAISDYTKAIEIDPKNEEAYYVRGIAYASKRDLDRAMADYNKAIEINPKYVQAYLNRGFINIMNGNFGEVIADINKVMDINPKVAMAYYIRALAYTNQNNMTQAISDYTKAIDIKPDYTEAYVNRALAYAYKDQIERSKTDPNSPKAYINVGLDSMNKENFDRAIADCNKAIELNPKYPDAYFIRARIYFLANDFGKVWADVHKVEELGSTVRPEFLEDLKKASKREK